MDELTHGRSQLTKSINEGEFETYFDICFHVVTLAALMVSKNEFRRARTFRINFNVYRPLG